MHTQNLFAAFPIKQRYCYRVDRNAISQRECVKINGPFYDVKILFGAVNTKIKIAPAIPLPEHRINVANTSTRVVIKYYIFPA